MKKPLTKSVAIVMAFVFTAIPAQANIGMQDIFNQMGAYGNTTSAGAYQGQTRNFYTGGSLFMRIPQKNYQLATLSPPSWGAGCGGIDLFAGAFSFINAEQFTALLRNIGASAIGYSFKLALQNMCPSCDNILTSLQDAANKVNRGNINSCQWGQGIAEATVSGNTERLEQNVTNIYGPLKGVFSDFSQAWNNTGSDRSSAKPVLDQAKTDPSVKDMAPNGNVVWKALQKVPLTDLQRSVFMSMVGTVVIEDGVPRVVPPATNNLLQAYLGGADGDGMPDLMVWDCSGQSADGCLSDRLAAPVALKNISPDEKGFRDMVRDRLMAIANNIESNSPNSNQDIAFINATIVPVYKAIAVQTAIGPDIAQTWIDEQADLIAVEYAAAFVNEAFRAIDAGLAQMRQQTNSVEADQIKVILENKNQIQQLLQAERNTAYQKVGAVNNLAKDVMEMERQMLSSLPPKLADSIHWARAQGK
jgi:conjugative transfer pilus assembly protein TraH